MLKTQHLLKTSALLLAITLCDVWALRSGQEKRHGHPQPVRVRQELRSLTSRELRLFVQGLSTMLSVDTEAGRKLYGINYKEYEYFIVKHAVAVKDPRGDQGHFGPCLMTYHRALILEFEASLLSVVPRLKAVPYWDVTLDLKGGKYFNTSNSVFSSAYAGAVSGDPFHGYAVTDGLLAWLKVPLFNYAKYGQYAHLFNGSQLTGQLRSYGNTNSNPYMTRYPSDNLLALGAAEPAVLAVGLSWDFTEADYMHLTDASVVKTWSDWYRRVDLGFNDSVFLHPGPHWFVGSVGADTPSTNWGEMYDVATSPNDVLLFMTHHANLDRNNMMWMRNALRLNASMGRTDVMWGYPKVTGTSAETGVTTVPGCALYDVISSNFGFPVKVFKRRPRSRAGYTHFEVLDYTRPGAAPYTYDTLCT